MPLTIRLLLESQRHEVRFVCGEHFPYLGLSKGPAEFVLQCGASTPKHQSPFNGGFLRTNNTRFTEQFA